MFTGGLRGFDPHPQGVFGLLLVANPRESFVSQITKPFGLMLEFTIKPTDKVQKNPIAKDSFGQQRALCQKNPLNILLEESLELRIS